MVDSSGKDFFLQVKVFKLFCDCCLWFWAKIVWVLQVIRAPPAQVIIVSQYFGLQIGVKGPAMVLSEFYPEVVVSLCDKFYRGLSLFWLIDVIACLWVGPSFDKRVFLKVCVSLDMCGKVVCLSSVDCFLHVG